MLLQFFLYQTQYIFYPIMHKIPTTLTLHVKKDYMCIQQKAYTNKLHVYTKKVLCVHNIILVKLTNPTHKMLHLVQRLLDWITSCPH
jgi:hypothetical protein